MKMRSILVLISSLGLLSFSAIAADSSSGCGLGWEVTQKQSLVSSAIRSTTNAILPNTFSMTFGTSNCQKHSIVKNESEQMYFVESNLDQLALEMAQGDGEYLRGLAAVMGCASAYGDFSSVVQKHYSEIFSGSVSPTRVLQEVKRGIRSNAALANSCGATT
jgi:hypothetical protein